MASNADRFISSRRIVVRFLMDSARWDDRGIFSNFGKGGDKLCVCNPYCTAVYGGFKVKKKKRGRQVSMQSDLDARRFLLWVPLTLWDPQRHPDTLLVSRRVSILVRLESVPHRANCSCGVHVHQQKSFGHSDLIGRFTLGTITNFNLNFMTLVIKFSLKIWLHPNLPKHPDIEVWMSYEILSIKVVKNWFKNA
jgi:hypothetical protein